MSAAAGENFRLLCTGERERAFAVNWIAGTVNIRLIVSAI